MADEKSQVLQDLVERAVGMVRKLRSAKEAYMGQLWQDSPQPIAEQCQLLIQALKDILETCKNIETVGGSHDKFTIIRALAEKSIASLETQQKRGVAKEPAPDLLNDLQTIDTTLGTMHNWYLSWIT